MNKAYVSGSVILLLLAAAAPPHAQRPVSAWPKFHGDAQNTGNSLAPCAQGRVRWVRRGNYGVFYTLAVGAGETVYVPCVGDGICAFDGTTGRTRKAFQAADRHVGGYNDPAIGPDGGIYAGYGTTSANGHSESAFTALDARTGALRWRTRLDAAALAPPAFGTSRNGPAVYFGCQDGFVYALDRRTGRRLWRFPTGEYLRTCPALSPDSALLYVGTREHCLDALDARTGSLRWHYDAHDVFNASPVVGPDGTVYAVPKTEGVCALDGRTGQVRWVAPLGGEVLATPALSRGGTLLVLTQGGELTGHGSHWALVALDARTGRHRWRAATPLTAGASPAVAGDGTVYYGTGDGRLVALDGRNGRQRWAVRTGGAISCSPAIGQDGTVYFTNDVDPADNKFYVYAVR